MSGQGWGAYQASELPVAHCIEVDLGLIKIMCNFLRPLLLVLVDAVCLCVEALSELIKILYNFFLKLFVLVDQSEAMEAFRDIFIFILKAFIIYHLISKQ